MQLLISVEPDTRRVPNLPLPPPPVPLSSLLPVPRPSPFGQLDLLPPRLLPPCAGELPSAPFAAGWRRVTSLSKNGRCRLSLSCSGLSFPRPLVRTLSFFPSCCFPFSLSASLVPVLSFFSMFLLLAPSFRLSLFLLSCVSALFHPLASVRRFFRRNLSLFLRRAGEEILSPSRPRPLASPLVLSLHRGCLYSVFHCGSHTCPVAGWPSLACRWRRAQDWGAGDEGRG